MKPIEELEFTDDFMFGAIMHNPLYCKGVIERLLNIQVDHLEYPELQKNISPFYDRKGIRMDVYVKDSDRIFDIEMQNKNYSSIGKRTRFYQSLMDSEQLSRGEDYESLKETFIIFICKDDPLKGNCSVYNVKSLYNTDSVTQKIFPDEIHRIFFNASAFEKENDPDLKKFLKFIYTAEPQDSFTKGLKSKIEELKIHDKFRNDYMTGTLWEHDKIKEITEWVTAEVTDKITAEVTDKITTEVTNKVTAEVTDKVTAEVKTETSLNNAIAAIKAFGVSAEMAAQTFNVNLELLKSKI